MAKDRSERFILIAGAMACLAALTSLFVREVGLPPYTPDSWSYFELSKTVFADFYKVSTMRQYHLAPDYGASFPPLWPTLIAIINAVFHLDWYGGYVLAFIASALTIPVLVHFCRRFFGQPLLGIFLYALALLDPAYRQELLSGGAIPLSIAIVFLLLAVLARRPFGPGAVALTALLAGLAAMNRFDFLLAGLAAGAVAAVTGGRSATVVIRRAALYFAVFFMTISPWIFYSWTRFSMPYVTDNARVALAAAQSFVTDFYINPLPTIFDAPLAWMVRYAQSLSLLGRTALEVASFSLAPLAILAVFVAADAGLRGRSAGDRQLRVLHVSAAVFMILYALFIIAGNDRYRPLALIPAALIAVIAVANARLRKRPLSEMFMLDETSWASLKVLSLAAPIFLIQLLSIATTGYFDRRYLSLAVLFACAMLLSCCCGALRRLGPARSSAFLSVMVFSLLLLQFHPSQPSIYRLPQAVLRNEEVLSCIGEKARLLVLDHHVVQPFEYGAVTGAMTYSRPLNIDARNAPELVRRYGITHVALDSRGMTSQLLTSEFGLNRLCGIDVYRLTAL